MDLKSRPYKFIPVHCENNDFPDFMLSADSLEMKVLFEVADKTDRDVSGLLTECLHEMFRKIMGLDLDNTTYDEWEQSIGKEEANKRVKLLADMIESNRR